MTQCNLKNEMCSGICTGYDGSHRWKNIHKEADLVECESCRPKAQNLMKFAHDVVNLEIGKKAFDKKNFHEHVEIVNCLASKCREKGLC